MSLQLKEERANGTGGGYYNFRRLPRDIDNKQSTDLSSPIFKFVGQTFAPASAPITTYREQ
jgi:hypothetical protein